LAPCVKERVRGRLYSLGGRKRPKMRGLMNRFFL